MVKKLFSIVLLCCCYLVPFWASAQASDAEIKYTAFDMRKEGKIYVLVTCMVIILVGLILYLVRLDRKITKFEKEIK
jgi:hypothetical protein